VLSFRYTLPALCTLGSAHTTPLTIFASNILPILPQDVLRIPGRASSDEAPSRCSLKWYRWRDADGDAVHGGDAEWAPWWDGATRGSARRWDAAAGQSAECWSAEWHARCSPIAPRRISNRWCAERFPAERFPDGRAEAGPSLRSTGWTPGQSAGWYAGHRTGHSTGWLPDGWSPETDERFPDRRSTAGRTVRATGWTPGG
jgi:hypothetical protein